MLTELDNFYLDKKEPIKSTLREIILKQDKDITEAWKYRMPFFCYHGKMFCYIWIHKRYREPYLGIVEGKKVKHPKLQMEKRARMKIMLLDPRKDLPVRAIQTVLRDALNLYKS